MFPPPLDGLEPEPGSPEWVDAADLRVDQFVSRWSVDGLRLRLLGLVHARSSRLILEQVAFDRDCGRTWQEIGADLGISRQAAYSRYASRVDS